MFIFCQTFVFVFSYLFFFKYDHFNHKLFFLSQWNHMYWSTDIYLWRKSTRSTVKKTCIDTGRSISCEVRSIPEVLVSWVNLLYKPAVKTRQVLSWHLAWRCQCVWQLVPGASLGLVRTGDALLSLASHSLLCKITEGFWCFYLTPVQTGCVPHCVRLPDEKVYYSLNTSLCVAVSDTKLFHILNMGFFLTRHIILE